MMILQNSQAPDKPGDGVAENEPAAPVAQEKPVHMEPSEFFSEIAVTTRTVCRGSSSADAITYQMTICGTRAVLMLACGLLKK